jgi:hypothetical protein
MLKLGVQKLLQRFGVFELAMWSEQGEKYTIYTLSPQLWISIQTQKAQPVDDAVSRLPNVPGVHRLVGKGYNTP